MQVGAIALLFGSALPAWAADLAHAEATPIKAPECIGDPSFLFFAENVEPTFAQHPVLPIGEYYQIVRYMGPDAVSSPVAYDYGFLPQSYPWPPFQGLALTGFSAPAPRDRYQRASRHDANADISSGFQLHCFDAGSYINTWSFAGMPISGGGPHSIYGYSFSASQLPPIYDSSPGTDFVLQASIEVPWFHSVVDPNAAPDVPVGQVNLFAYFLDRSTGKVFGETLAVFDNRYTAPGATYTPFVAHDGFTPFVSTPINASSKYATLSPYSATFTGNTWTGLRFFRAHVTQDDFRQALADINALCAANPALRTCSSAVPGAPAFSTSVTDYVLTDFGVIHEVTPPGPVANLSMGVHVYGLGAWNLR